MKKATSDERNRRIKEEEPHAFNSNKKFIHGNKYSDELKDLVLKLLVKDQKERLGAKNDYIEIFEHPAFH